MIRFLLRAWGGIGIVVAARLPWLPARQVMDDPRSAVPPSDDRIDEPLLLAGPPAQAEVAVNQGVAAVLAWANTPPGVTVEVAGDRRGR